jgi:hypothetical protein
MAPKAGFQRLMGCIFEHPENRIVKKTNPNVSYSEIHVGNNQWELAHDGAVLPKIIHHMTTAALERINTYQMPICDGLKTFVRKVNENDECREYIDTKHNIKFIIINTTRRLNELDA